MCGRYRGPAVQGVRNCGPLTALGVTDRADVNQEHTMHMHAAAGTLVRLDLILTSCGSDPGSSSDDQSAAE